MIRYAVRVKTAGNAYQASTIMYEAIGIGMSPDPQEAHLYTKLELAEKKAKQYRKDPQWYAEVDIIPVTVSWDA